MNNTERIKNNMISPSIDKLSKENKYNRYTMVIAVSKCARMVTDEYVSQREIAERKIAAKETEKPLSSMIEKNFRDVKAVRIGINRLYDGEYAIDDSTIDLDCDR